MVSTSLLSILAAVAAVARAANYDVNVGADGLNFTPASVSDAVQGDTITFRFSGMHSASESTLTDPCTKKSGGFDSGQLTGGTYQVTLNSTDPVWVYCNVGGHCRAGMVFAVNPGSNLAAFQAAAQGQTVSSTGSTGGSSTGSASSAHTSSTGSSGGGSGGGYGSPGAASRSSSSSSAFWVLAGTLLGVAAL